MKFFKIFATIAVVALGLLSCSKSDELTTSSISGNYVGTAKIFGYSEEPKRAYATLTRMSEDVVSFKLACEGYGLDFDPVNLIVEKKNGVVTLTSESTYAIDGSITADVLTVTFRTSNYTYMFSGKKD